MKIKTLLLAGFATLALSACGHKLKDGNYQLHILSTNDVHSTWFDSTYVGSAQRNSLFAMNHYIDSVRSVYGFDNIALIDAGDCLQGDNAAYYYNYVDTLSPHLFPRLMGYMKYDAIAVGNHDIETGHPVYDRVSSELLNHDAPFLAANAIRLSDGRAYFPEYKILHKAGLKVAVIGYTNANIKAWLTEELYEGMTFQKIIDQVSSDIEKVRSKEKPDVMVVAMHSGCGNGDGKIRENEALDVFNNIKGIDFLVCGHDHRPNVITRDTTCLLNSGSHSRYVAHGTLDLVVKDGKVAGKTFASELIKVKPEMADTAMRAAFLKEYQAVKAFTLKPVGTLNTDLVTRDAYAGMCDYLNLIHTVGLGCAPAEISIAAPLTYNGTVKAGGLIYNDLFTIYPYENQLFVIKMTGLQIKNYLEKSYDQWVNTVSSPEDHILKIQKTDDPRTQQKGWSFIWRTYNFDSAAGINYTVDVTKPFGQRIIIGSMASGAPFSLERTYNVAMTSYRASGGGNLLRDGAGIDTERISDITVARYPEIREIIYQYLQANGSIDKEVIGRKDVIGSWSFVPRALAAPALARDLSLLFK